jgi:hypothetical protein
MVQRDAEGGGDVSQGQIHHLRSQGEEIQEGNTQSVPGWMEPQHSREHVLTEAFVCYRAAEMDQGQSTRQSTRLLGLLKHETLAEMKAHEANTLLDSSLASADEERSEAQLLLS